jgi:lysophospholipase L1-like esterase
MLDLCAELALDCLDPLADFQGRARAGEALYYADDMHLNAAGNAALAQLLAEYLKERAL